jgi:hypothetical protein
MFTSHKTKVIAAISLIAVLFSTSSLQADEAIRGRVQNHAGNRVNACFDANATPTIGDEFALVRHVISTQPKSPSAIRSEYVGAIRVASVRGDGCADAVLLRGNVQSLDWIALPAKS